MAFTEREAAAAAQIAEAQNAFAQHRRAEAAVRALGGDFVWKAEADGDHLHRVSANGEVLKDFGPRSARLEAIANAHEKKKSEAYASLEHWIRERDRMQQLNRAHQVGRLLDTPVKVLEVLWRRGLMDYYTVIGTYAMYAYEAAAGVVFNEETMATNDVDLFLTAGKQMKFAELVTDQRRKGMKGNTGVHPNCRRTQFEKGSRPHTWLPVGSYRVVPGGSGHTTLILEKKVNDLPGPNKRAVAPGAPAGVGGR